MRNKRITAIVFCSIMLLGGCGNAGTGVVETALEPRAQETETAQSDNSVETDGVREVPAQTAGNTAADVVVAEAGPDKPLYDTGNLIYKLYGFQLYESPEEAAIAQDAIKIEDAREYMDKSKFLTMQAEIQNIDYPGDEGDGDGELNLSLFVISPDTGAGLPEWEGSYPVYLSEHGTGETDYYHVWVKPGETKTVTVGFYVPVKDIAELRSRCKIMFYGSCDEGYVYEIPEVQ